jgi:hypothetical protein
MPRISLAVMVGNGLSSMIAHYSHNVTIIHYLLVTLYNLNVKSQEFFSSL